MNGNETYETIMARAARLGISTPGEAVDYALHLMAQLVDELESGGQLLVQRDRDVHELVLRDATGSVQLASLIIEGVAITDSDHDGLDDGWEKARLGNKLDYGPQDDPDGDGYSNAREQVMGTDPLTADVAFQLDLSPWDKKLARLSWPGVGNMDYEVLAGTNVAALTLQTNLQGRFPETEWFTPYTNATQQFFRVRSMPAP